MDRRGVLKFLALSSALPAMPGGVLAAFREIHSSLGSVPSLKILTPHQNATVVALSELIIPATNTPGAKDTRVNEFIDRVVAEWYSDEERSRFLAGLADVDARTQHLFQTDFADASPTQQTVILGALGEEMAEAMAALAAAPRGYRGSAPEPDGNFYLIFRQLTLTGYFTSEAGFTLQLHEEIIPGRYDGCVPPSSAAQTKGS